MLKSQDHQINLTSPPQSSCMRNTHGSEVAEICSVSISAMNVCNNGVLISRMEQTQSYIPARSSQKVRPGMSPVRTWAVIRYGFGVRVNGNWVRAALTPGEFRKGPRASAKPSPASSCSRRPHIAHCLQNPIYRPVIFHLSSSSSSTFLSRFPSFLVIEIDNDAGTRTLRRPATDSQGCFVYLVRRSGWSSRSHFGYVSLLSRPLYSASE